MPANLENSAVATGLEKVSFHSNPKERQHKECSNYCTIALISHSSKVILKIIQVRQTSTVLEPRISICSIWFYKNESNQRSNCQHPLDHWKNKRVPKIFWIFFLLYWLYQSLWLCGSLSKKEFCGEFFKRWEYQTTWPVSWEICMQIKKQQLELDME